MPPQPRTSPVIDSPRTPQWERCLVKGSLRAPIPKGRRGRNRRAVDFSDFSAKSLIVERVAPTGCACFSTGCDSASTECAVFSTCAVFRQSGPVCIYLSLLKKKRRREEGPEGKNAIHANEQLPKKASTGFTPHPRVFRGNRGMQLFSRINELSSGYGVFHVSTGCFASRNFERGEK